MAFESFAFCFVSKKGLGATFFTTNLAYLSPHYT